MRLGRSIDRSWNTPWLEEAIEQTDMSQSISADALVLAPYGPKGGLKGGVVIRSEDGSFRVDTLMLEAKRIQQITSAQMSRGVGLYRLGWQKRLPSYYIGEYVDRAGHMR